MTVAEREHTSPTGTVMKTFSAIRRRVNRLMYRHAKTVCKGENYAKRFRVSSSGRFVDAMRADKHLIIQNSHGIAKDSSGMEMEF